ncbi:unnamed protein product [Rotaria sp. Silwood2]|nr:unnamed protein product [Rotaria sp. Silwood2]CAF4271189.1 unnamed protein product [Rotaria sp. Silwood2]
MINGQVHNKLPTLVLRLQSPSSSRHEHMVNQYGSFDESDHYTFDQFIMRLNEFRQELFANIDYFRQIVLSARPKQVPGMYPAEYQRLMDVYNEFLAMSTAIVVRIQESFKDVMQEYRAYLESVWLAVQNGQSTKKLQRQFERRIQQKMKKSWQPVFESVDRLVRDIEVNANSIASYTPSHEHFDVQKYH